MSDLRIALVQSSLAWEDPGANHNHFEKIIEGITRADLILLPEMFSTGFSMHAERLAESYPGPSLLWMEALAKKKDACIIGSVITHDEGKYFNRLYCAFPSGLHAFYDKRHTFTFAGEDKVYSKGEKKIIIDWKGWRILPQICYDLRFPVWSRNHQDNPYDLLLYVANWPDKRISAWDALLPARAIENACYTAGVNRVGIDGKEITYNGHSGVYNYLGNELVKDNEKEEVLMAELSLSKLRAYRKKFPVLYDSDAFQIIP